MENLKKPSKEAVSFQVAFHFMLFFSFNLRSVRKVCILIHFLNRWLIKSPAKHFVRDILALF